MTAGTIGADGLKMNIRMTAGTRHVRILKNQGGMTGLAVHLRMLSRQGHGCGIMIEGVNALINFPPFRTVANLATDRKILSVWRRLDQHPGNKQE